ncbi:hypothetical protein F383_19946 [Gossypium arboreum]|uniref:Uncharacterized protein n=1 Tax=Gossypium arboreum TaxID=29729 RepID=A0A0B0MHZ9_GOSAR|nr:hypothetical protein F383_19946 [Gossypium arboreum]
MELEMTSFYPHRQTHGRVSRPCVTHGLCSNTSVCLGRVKPTPNFELN